MHDNEEYDEFENDYRLKDNSMGIMLDERGEPETCPEDLFMNHGQTVDDWLVSATKFFDNKSNDTIVARNEAIVQNIQEKLERYKLSLKLYENAGGDFSDLRQPPHVIENYTPTMDCSGDMVRYFIYKEHNNGTTYRIVDHKVFQMDYR